MSIAVVTDSTACLSAHQSEQAGIAVVPLHVVVEGRGSVAAREISPGEVADIMTAGTERVSTSRPSPGEFVAAYREVAQRTGCTGIVSVHLSATVSGTVEAAEMARDELVGEIQVHVVDSRVMAMALGYAALAAAQAAGRGSDADAVCHAAQQQAAASSTWFYVDTLEHLRRGGRIGAAAALFGSALSIKPLLGLVDGQVQAVERVRTRSKALARLVDRVVAAVNDAGGGRDIAPAMGEPSRVAVAIHELAARDAAQEVADAIRDRTGLAAQIIELDPVVGVHTGPGTVGVVVAPALG